MKVIELENLEMEKSYKVNSKFGFVEEVGLAFDVKKQYLQRAEAKQMIFQMSKVRVSNEKLVCLGSAETQPRLQVRQPWEIKKDQQYVEPDSSEAFRITNG